MTYNKGDWYQKNKEKVKKRVKQWRLNNPKEYKESCKKYYDKNKAKIIARQKSYDKKKRLTDPTYRLKKLEYNRNYFGDHKYYQEHKTSIIASVMKYNRAHMKKINIHKRERRQSDPEYKLKEACRSRARKIITTESCSKCGSTNNLQRHHEDYTKPLEVTVLCKDCHININESKTL